MSALTFTLSSMMSLLEQLLLFEDDESEMLSVEIITYSHKHMDTHTRAARFNEIFANILGYTYTQVRIPKQAEVVLWVARLNVDLDNKNWHVCGCVCARGFFSPHFIANISGVHMTCACLILYNNNTQKICQNEYIYRELWAAAAARLLVLRFFLCCGWIHNDGQDDGDLVIMMMQQNEMYTSEILIYFSCINYNKNHAEWIAIASQTSANTSFGIHMVVNEYECIRQFMFINNKFRLI